MKQLSLQLLMVCKALSLGRPLRINRLSQGVLADRVDQEEAATVVVAIMVVATVVVAIMAAATVAVATVTVATVVVIMAVATVAAATVVAATVVAATVVVILALIILTPIDLQVQKVGKIEVMEILLKTQNMKAVGVGEKGVFLMRVILQMKIISNPFLQV